MLQHGQLIRIVADVVQDSLNKGLGWHSAHEQKGADNRIPSLLASQTRNEVLAPIERFGKTRELRAIPEEVRSHRQDYIDRDCDLLDGVEQCRHEMRSVGNCRALVTLAPVSEYLLELIDDDEDTLTCRHTRILDHPRQAARRRVDRLVSVVDPDGIVRTQAPRYGRGQCPHRVRARPHQSQPPARRRTPQVSALERRQQAGLDQRRFAATGCTDNREKPIGTESAKQFFHLSFAPEEQQRLFGFE
jgi:hypothetical protein